MNANKKNLPALLAIVACLSAAPVQAQSPGEAPKISVRGFGTLGAVHSSERNADYVSGFFEPTGAGYTRPWALGVDTKLGVQFDAALTRDLSAVLQVVSLHRYDNTYTPEVEWANVKYQVTPDLDLRLGRTVTMTYLVSDSRMVGYSYPWVRPPQEVYGLVPITNKDGVDGTYRMHFGGLTDSWHASYGSTTLNLPSTLAVGAGTVRASRFFDLANTAEYGPFTARASYSTGHVSLHTPQLDALISGFSQLGGTLSGIPALAAPGAQASDIANRYGFDNARISVYTLGGAYDRERWLLMSEWAKFDGHSILMDSRAWYATAAYRFAAFTPYVTAARLSVDRVNENGISLGGLPAIFAGPAAQLNTGLATAISSAAFAQHSLSAGVRWDFAKNMDLKLQYDRIELDAGSSGRLGNVQPSFQPGGKVNVISIAVDFVF